MARKKYKLTAAVTGSPQYAANGNTYLFRSGFEMAGLPLTLMGASACPVITADASTVMGTDNDWAQQMLANQTVNGGLLVNGVNYCGTPVGAMTLEETLDPETLDLDAIFPTT